MRTDPKRVGQGIWPQGYKGRELLTPGHAACPGCGTAMAMRLALKALGPETVLVLPTSCFTFAAGPFPFTSLRVPALHTPFATAAAAASGVRAALDERGDGSAQVVAWAGDFGTFGAGLSALTLAAQRNENIIFVCCDNEAAVAVGGMRSEGRGCESPALESLRGIPYFAATTPALPHDFMYKFAKARSIRGFRFIHVLASCPSSWRIDPARSVEAMRDSALTGAFPMYEIEEGRLTINVKPRTTSERIDRLLRADDGGEL